MKTKKLTTAQLALLLAVMGLFSKLLGFVREMILANYYGAGYVTDAYVMSVSIPNNLLAPIVGATATAYMPILSKKSIGSQSDANRFTSQIINFLLLFTGLSSIVGWIFASQIVSVLAPGFSGETFSLTVYNLRIAFVMVVFSIFSNILSSYLEFKGSFIPKAALAYVQNLSIIVAIVVSAKLNVPQVLIYGITLGFLYSSIGELYFSRQFGYRYSLDCHFNESIKEVLAFAIPVIIGGCTSELNTFVDRMLASSLPEGSVSALNYGNLFCNVITGFTVSVFVSIMYPRLTKAFADKDSLAISDMSQKGFSVIFVFMVPLMFGSLLYSSQLVQVIYERGAFNVDATNMTSIAYRYYSIALVFTGLRFYLDKIYYSVHDTITPVKCSVVSIAINIVLNLILVGPMGHGGLALATSIGQIVGTGLLFFLFERKHPEIVLFNQWGKLIKIVLFSGISCAISYAFYYFVGNAIWMPKMVLLGLAVIIAMVVYLIFLILAKFEDLNIFYDLIGKRKKEA